MNIKELYDNDVNIMQYYRDKVNIAENTTDSILMSYDLQAGSYIDSYIKNKISDNYHENGKRVELSCQEASKKFCKFIASEIKKFDFTTILEAGVGEATSLNLIADNFDSSSVKFSGFDLAPSRIMHAKGFLKTNNKKADLIVANLLKTPYEDNAFDIVYTIHAIEPNTLNCEKILKELYRITNKYLILVEPSFELGNQATKENIEKHKYIKNLSESVHNLGYKIIKYELCPVGTYSNQPAIMIIEKNGSAKSKDNVKYACPICHKELIYDGNYFCNECFRVFPEIKNIPLLTEESSIVFTQYLN